MSLVSLALPFLLTALSVSPATPSLDVALSPGSPTILRPENAFILMGNQRGPQDSLSVSTSAYIIRQHDGLYVEFTVPDSSYAELRLVDEGGEVVATPNGRSVPGPGSWKLLWRGMGDDTFVVDPGRYLFTLKQGANQRTTPIRVLPWWSVPGELDNEFYLFQFEVIDKLLLASQKKDVELLEQILAPGFRRLVKKGQDGKVIAEWGREAELAYSKELFDSPLVEIVSWTFELGEPRLQKFVLSDGTKKSLTTIPLVGFEKSIRLISGETVVEAPDGGGALLFRKVGDVWMLQAVEEYTELR